MSIMSYSASLRRDIKRCAAELSHLTLISGSPSPCLIPSLLTSLDSLTRRNSVVEALDESELDLHQADAALGVAA